MTVQGGGTLVIETEGNGMKLVGTDFTVQSGGTVEADNLHVEADTLTVEDSANIRADKLVSRNLLLTCSVKLHPVSIH